MAYFNLGTNATTAMTFGGTSLTCLQSIEVTGNAPTTEVECAGSTTVSFINGIPRFRVSVTGAVDDSDATLLNAIQPNDNGAIAMDPAGTASGTIDISSTSATVQDFNVSFPVNGFSQYSATFLLDDITIGSNA